MSNPLPAWAQPGTEAAVYHTRYHTDPTATIVAIERLTASQVLTSDGARWVNVSSFGEENLRILGKRRYDGPILIPADDPRTIDAQRVAEIRSAEMDVHNAYDAWRRTPRDASLGTALAQAASKEASLAAAYASSKEAQ